MFPASIDHGSPVFALAVSRDERLLALAGKAGSPVSVWEIDSGRRIAALPTASGGADLAALAFSADGQRLAVANARGAIWTWDIANERVIGSAPPRKQLKSRRLVFVDGKKGDALAMSSGTSKSGAFSLPSPDGRRAATFGLEAAIVSKKGKVEEARLRLYRYPIAKMGIRHACWSGDGRALALIGDHWLGAWFPDDQRFFVSPYPISMLRYGVALIRRLGLLLVPNGNRAPFVAGLPEAPTEPILTPWEELVRRVESTPPPPGWAPKNRWEWNATRSGYEGVALEEGGLVWYQHSHDAHAGGAAREQSYESYLATGPDVAPPPAEIGEEIYRAVAARIRAPAAS
jgi:hypothetical protein